MTKLKLVGLTATIVSAMAFSFAFADGHTGNTAKPLAGLEFAPLLDTPIEIAVLWGNPQEGESAVMLKFPPNFPGGMHSHANAYHAVVVSGASKHWVEGETEADALLQRPGDYWYQAGGQVHQDSFPTDAETILFLQFDGPIDTDFVE
jgi:quercetin dioxygenase-like cupin family protein